MRVAYCTIFTAIFLAQPAPAQEVLSGEQLAAIAGRVRDFTPRDQFDVAPQMPSLAGKRFSYTITPLELGPARCDGYPDWLYVASRGQLHVSWSPGFALSYELKGKPGATFPPNLVSLVRNSELAFRAFTCRKIAEPDYMASNAFGAQFKVTKSTEFVTAVADFEPIVERGFANSWNVAAAGDAARTLSQNIRVRVGGSLADWGSGVSVVCGAKLRAPTIRLPQDKAVNICMVRGRPDRVEVIDASTGKTLFLTTRKPK